MRQSDKKLSKKKLSIVQLVQINGGIKTNIVDRNGKKIGRVVGKS